MTLNELTALLAMVAANDRRTTGDADLEIWYDALHDLPFTDCRAVVLKHTREGEGWLTPADVRRGVKAIRTDRLSRVAMPVPPAELCADPAGYAAWIRNTTEAIASGELTETAIAPSLPPKALEAKYGKVFPKVPAA